MFGLVVKHFFLLIIFWEWSKDVSLNDGEIKIASLSFWWFRLWTCLWYIEINIEVTYLYKQKYIHFSKCKKKLRKFVLFARVNSLLRLLELKESGMMTFSFHLLYLLVYVIRFFPPHIGAKYREKCIMKKTVWFELVVQVAIQSYKPNKHLNFAAYLKLTQNKLVCFVYKIINSSSLEITVPRPVLYCSSIKSSDL